jgi:hypothetical protein
MRTLTRMESTSTFNCFRAFEQRLERRIGNYLF